MGMRVQSLQNDGRTLTFCCMLHCTHNQVLACSKMNNRPLSGGCRHHTPLLRCVLHHRTSPSSTLTVQTAQCCTLHSLLADSRSHNGNRHSSPLPCHTAHLLVSCRRHTPGSLHSIVAVKIRKMKYQQYWGVGPCSPGEHVHPSFQSMGHSNQGSR